MSATLNFVELRKLIVQVWSLTTECVCSFCVAAWLWAPALCALCSDSMASRRSMKSSQPMNRWRR